MFDNFNKLVRDLTSLLEADEGAVVFSSNRAAMQILEDHGYKFPEYDEDVFCRDLIHETVDWDQDSYWIRGDYLNRFLESS